MSEVRPAREDQPIGLAQVAADDLLLDALGKGDPAPDSDDSVAAMLGAWRADLDTEPAPPVDGLPAPDLGRARPRRLSRTLLSAAAAALVIFGLGVATHQAGPGNPLWPLTRVVYPQRAEVAAAETAIDEARAAMGAGRYGEARRQLATAAEHAGRIDNPTVAGRVRAEIEAIQRELNTVAPAAPATPAPATTAGAPAPKATPAPAASPAPPKAPGAGSGRTNPTTAPTPAPKPPLAPKPSLPDLPLPSIKLPPLTPLPTILPTGLPLNAPGR